MLPRRHWVTVRLGAVHLTWLPSSSIRRGLGLLDSTRSRTRSQRTENWFSWRCIVKTLTDSKYGRVASARYAPWSFSLRGVWRANVPCQPLCVSVSNACGSKATPSEAAGKVPRGCRSAPAWAWKRLSRDAQSPWIPNCARPALRGSVFRIISTFLTFNNKKQPKLFYFLEFPDR